MTCWDEAQVEHDSAKLLVRELRHVSPSDPFYDAKLTVLKEYIKHHVTEEEQARTGIFEAARAVGVDLKSLADEINERREELERDEQGRFLSDDDRGSGSSRSGRHDDDRGGRGSGGGQGQGGWFGGSRGHLEAARRGWENR